MPIVMNSNVSALTAQRNLDIAQRNFEAGSAVLAQANQSPAAALSLLR